MACKTQAIFILVSTKRITFSCKIISYILLADKEEGQVMGIRVKLDMLRFEYLKQTYFHPECH
jgi:hypothetical protein